jgi:hypothetical protein
MGPKPQSADLRTYASEEYPPLAAVRNEIEDCEGVRSEYERAVHESGATVWLILGVPHFRRLGCNRFAREIEDVNGGLAFAPSIAEPGSP